MVVGADVTHPGDEEECPSIAAVVATNDEESFQYLGSARLQEGKQEVYDTIYSLFICIANILTSICSTFQISKA